MSYTGEMRGDTHNTKILCYSEEMIGYTIFNFFIVYLKLNRSANDAMITRTG